MATIPEVKIKISGDPKGFAGAVKTAQGSLTQLSGSLAKVQSLAAKAFTFGGIGGAASVAGLITAATNLATLSKELTTFATASNVGTEEFQKLAAGAKTVGIDSAKLADIFKDVQDKVGEFLQTGGGPLKDFFDQIAPKVGVTAAQFRNLSGPQALQLYVSSLEKANLSQSQFTFFLEAIASDSARLLPLLRENGKGFREAGEEAQRLGGILSDDLVKQSVEFEKSLERLRTLSRGVTIDIGSSLIPALNELATEFLDARTSGLGFFEALVGIGLRNPLKSAQEQIQSLTSEIEKLQESIKESSNSSDGSITGIVAGQDTIRLQTLIKLRRFYEAQAKTSGRAEITFNDAKNAAILKAEDNLQAGITKLRDLQAKASKASAAEEIKGAERLRDALRTAWQASIDGATKAREEAKKLLGDAADAKKTGSQKAQDRLDGDKTPQQLDAEARPQAEKLRSEANFAAQSAVIAAFQGRLDAAKQLADVALAKAGEAEELSKKILSNTDAANLLKKLGGIKSDALKAQSIVKEKEAVNLEGTAEGQNAELTKVEDRIKALKAELEKPINLTMEIAAAELSIKTLQAQLDGLKDKKITVTVETVTPEKQITNLDTGEVFSLPRGPVTPGFASGGYTGAGGKYQPAGIVHAGEFVLRQEVVKQRGMRSLLDRLNLEGMNALGQRGYANGGMVTGSAPTPINLQWPDGTSSQVSAEKSVAEQIERTFRRAALSRGRRKS